MFNLNIKEDSSNNNIVEDNLTNLIEYIDTNLKNDVMEMALEHFKESFPSSNSDIGGYMTDASSNGWEIRKKQYEHPALNKTGALKNSLRIEDNSIVSDTEYGIYHNDGTSILPQRQFIGDSVELNNKITDFIQSKIETILQ